MPKHIVKELSFGRRHRSALIFFAVGFSVVAYGFWQVLRPSAAPLVWAAVLATVCHPLYALLTRVV